MSNNNSNSIYIPMLSSDLIDQLDISISSCVLNSKDFNKSDRQIWFEAGQRALVETLKARLELTKEEEKENILSSLST